MAEVRHRVGIRGSLANLFAALPDPNGLAGWWATCASETPEVGKSFELTFGDLVMLSFLVRELKPSSLLTLECTSPPVPWPGSQLRFVLEKTDDQSSLILTHGTEEADDDSFLYFDTKWPLYLLSLRDYIETGNGRPYPDDVEIYYGH